MPNFMWSIMSTITFLKITTTSINANSRPNRHRAIQMSLNKTKSGTCPIRPTRSNALNVTLLADGRLNCKNMPPLIQHHVHSSVSYVRLRTSGDGTWQSISIELILHLEILIRRGIAMRLVPLLCPVRHLSRLRHQHLIII